MVKLVKFHLTSGVVTKLTKGNNCLKLIQSFQ
jgi:hypothetical protein